MDDWDIVLESTFEDKDIKQNDEDYKTYEFGDTPTFKDTSDFLGVTSTAYNTMFGGCRSSDEIWVQKLEECVPLDDPRARRAMVRMLRRPVHVDDISVPTQTTGTCWFFSALTAMFLSDKGRISNLPLRETMILGRKGYKRDAEKVGVEYRYPLLVLNRTIHLLLDGSPKHTDRHHPDLDFEQLLGNKNILRRTEAHLAGLKAGDNDNEEIDWAKVLRLAQHFHGFQERKKPFHNNNSLAFMEGITHLTSQIPTIEFRSISSHEQPLPTFGNFSTIIRYGLIYPGLKESFDAEHDGYTDFKGDYIHEDAAEKVFTPKKKLKVGDNTYTLDAMILESRPVDNLIDDRIVCHATSCIHLNGVRYWFDSNEAVLPEKYDWYELLDKSTDVERPMKNPYPFPIYYNIHELFSILLYQKEIA